MKKNVERTTELRKKSIKELYSELALKRSELAHLRISVSMQKEKSVSKIKTLSSDIARILTVIRSNNER